MSSLNDLAWYNRNPELLQAAGRIQFPYRPGLMMPIGRQSTSTSTPTEWDTSVPGVMELDWVPSFGYSVDSTSPATIVGKEIFARVRKAYSGSIEVDAPDFMMYLGALDSIFSYLGFCKRVFRIISSYTPQNLHLPESLLVAMGFSPSTRNATTPVKGTIEELQQHKMRLYQYINEMIQMVGRFECPAVMDLFNRHYWMNDNVYADSPEATAQFYVFNQIAYYQFDPTLSKPAEGVTAGGLTLVQPDFYTQSSPGTNIVERMYTFGTQLINALADEDDSYIISGYLMRAYEGQPVFKVDPLMYDEAFIPVYVPEVLTQIENANWCPGISLQMVGTDSSKVGAGSLEILGDITQDPATNSIKSSPSVRRSATISTGTAPKFDNHVMPHLSMREVLPSADQITIATRLQAFYQYTGTQKPNKAGYYTYTFDVYCGSEFLVNAWLINKEYVTWPGDKLPVTLKMGLEYMVSAISNMATEIWEGQMLLAFKLATWDWHPMPVYLGTEQVPVIGEAYSGTSVVSGQPMLQRSQVGSFFPIGDVHNFTTFNSDVLTNLHRICLYSEFNTFGQL